MNTKQKINAVKSSYSTLVQTLPINEIINPLYQEDVLTTTALKEIRALPLSQSKTMHKSENVIAQELGEQLEVKSTEKFSVVKYGKPII